ncbi:MAG: mercury(II) reductase [Gemmatimonadota bacterium]
MTPDGSRPVVMMPNETRQDFDLAILGAGSAGFAAAIKAAELGARVALIEGSTLGGTCVNVGCVPSKTLIRAAEAQHRRTHHAFDGVAKSDGAPNWAAVRTQKDALVSSLRQRKYWDVLRAYDSVTLFELHARLAAGNQLSLSDGRTIVAQKLIVTTGSSPWLPPIRGLAEASPLDNATAMALDRLPSSMIVIGGSAVGVELAQMFARLGVQVTILEALPQLVPNEDHEIGAALANYLRGEGLAIDTSATITHVESAREGRTVRFRSQDGETRTVRAEQLLVATGRRANTNGFGLEAAGVKLGGKGEILVDGFLATANADIYAAGDVLGDPMFVYVAAYAGTVAAENALSGNVRKYDLTAVPRVTFSDPAIASVGCTDAEARRRGIEPLVSALPLEHVPRALVAHDTRGFVKLVADAVSRRILGAHILSSEAGEMITEPALAIQHGLTIDDLTSTFHPYLTLSEAIKLAAQAFSRDVRTLSCCAA